MSKKTAWSNKLHGKFYDGGLKEAQSYTSLKKLQSAFASLNLNSEIGYDQRDESNKLLKATFDVFSPYELASVLGRMLKSKSKGK